MKATNIQWYIDPEYKNKVSLPSEIEIPDNMTDEDEISDYISNQTGYCHCGFTLEKQKL